MYGHDDRVICFIVGEETICPRCMGRGEPFDDVYTLEQWERDRDDFLIYCDRCGERVSG